MTKELVCHRIHVVSGRSGSSRNQASPHTAECFAVVGRHRAPELSNPLAQAGEFLTTAQGLRLPDTDHSLKAGRRGPTLMEDFHLREKITHFDHERIPERVVHARGAAAHGVFRSYGTAASATKAKFLAEEGRETPVFVRPSTASRLARIG